MRSDQGWDTSTGSAPVTGAGPGGGTWGIGAGRGVGAGVVGGTIIGAGGTVILISGGGGAGAGAGGAGGIGAGGGGAPQETGTSRDITSNSTITVISFFIMITSSMLYLSYALRVSLHVHPSLQSGGSIVTLAHLARQSLLSISTLYVPDNLRVHQ